MHIVDNALRWCVSERRPIGVALVGAGFMGRAIALQIATAVPGIRIVAIVTGDPIHTKASLSELGITNLEIADSPSEIRHAFHSGATAITDDYRNAIESEFVDVVVDATGALEYGARVITSAIDQGKNVVLMNAELDGTVGPILKKRADKAHVIYSNVDGDQPGVTMNLYRFVKGIGIRPVVCGNIKGLHDPYRTPETQKSFAERWGQKPHMVTSFADGTKVSFEQATVANATGMLVAQRGMLGPTVQAGTPIEQAATRLDAERFIDTPGIVDYVTGAIPAPGVFILGAIEDPRQRRFLELYKLGSGPLYCFYTPYHLCHFEVPNTIARVVLFGDATIAPINGPVVDVIAAAKRNLSAGEILDDLGHYMTYGLCENALSAHTSSLLPIGLAPGCRLKRDIAKDSVISYADVVFPEDRLIDQLRLEQNEMFFEPNTDYSPELNSPLNRLSFAKR